MLFCCMPICRMLFCCMLISLSCLFAVCLFGECFFAVCLFLLAAFLLYAFLLNAYVLYAFLLNAFLLNALLQLSHIETVAENHYWRKFWLLKRRPNTNVYLSARHRSLFCWRWKFTRPQGLAFVGLCVRLKHLREKHLLIVQFKVFIENLIIVLPFVELGEVCLTLV